MHSPSSNRVAPKRCWLLGTRIEVSMMKPNEAHANLKHANEGAQTTNHSSSFGCTCSMKNRSNAASGKEIAKIVELKLFLYFYRILIAMIGAVFKATNSLGWLTVFFQLARYKVIVEMLKVCSFSLMFYQKRTLTRIFF